MKKRKEESPEVWEEVQQDWAKDKIWMTVKEKDELVRGMEQMQEMLKGMNSWVKVLEEMDDEVRFTVNSYLRKGQKNDDE